MSISFKRLDNVEPLFPGEKARRVGYNEYRFYCSVHQVRNSLSQDYDIYVRHDPRDYKYSAIGVFSDCECDAKWLRSPPDQHLSLYSPLLAAVYWARQNYLDGDWWAFVLKHNIQ